MLIISSIITHAKKSANPVVSSTELIIPLIWEECFAEISDCPSKRPIIRSMRLSCSFTRARKAATSFFSSATSVSTGSSMMGLDNRMVAQRGGRVIVPGRPVIEGEGAR